MRRIVFLWMASAIALIWLTACAAPTLVVPLKMEISAWAGVEPAQLASDLGYYAQRGTSVEMTRFSAYTDGIQALRSGRVDAGMQTLDDVIRSISLGHKLKVVLFTDYSYGGDGIVARNSIRTLADLKGKTVGVEIGSVSHYSLLQAIAHAGISESDFSIVSIPAWEIKENFLAGKIDAGVTWEPYLTESAREGNGRVLVTSRDYPRTIVTTMVMSEKLLTTRRADAQKIVAAYFDALDYTFKNPDHAYDLMGKAEGVSRVEFASHVAGIQFFDLAANRNAFKAGHAESMYEQTEAIIDFLFKRNLIKTRPSAKDVLDGSFVQGLP
jgi:NitT/TauT family transport system substrate-binding protein